MPERALDRYLVKSLVHAAAILQAFQSPGEVLRLRDIVERTGYGKGMWFARFRKQDARRPAPSSGRTPSPMRDKSCDRRARRSSHRLHIFPSATDRGWCVSRSTSCRERRCPRLSSRGNVVFGGIQTSFTNANFGRVSSQANTPSVGQIKVRLEF